MCPRNLLKRFTLQTPNVRTLVSNISRFPPAELRRSFSAVKVNTPATEVLTYWRSGERIEPLPNSHPLISELERDRPYLAWISTIVKPSELSRIYSGPVGRPGISHIVLNTQNLQMYLGLCRTNPAVRQIHILWQYPLKLTDRSTPFWFWQMYMQTFPNVSIFL